MIEQLGPWHAVWALAVLGLSVCIFGQGTGWFGIFGRHRRRRNERVEIDRRRS